MFTSLFKDMRLEKSHVTSVTPPKSSILNYVNIDDTPFIKNIDEIDLISSINGLSIEEIESRAKPNRFAASGFLGNDEKFLDVIKSDWETVLKHNTTNQVLAKHLYNIIKLADEAKNTPAIIEYNSIKYSVIILLTRGLQYDLFSPKAEVEIDQDCNVETPSVWNDDIIIENLNNNTKARLTTGSLSYIHYFGFYEGGKEQNIYRNAPENLIKLLEL